jgi:hypothetical protein
MLCPNQGAWLIFHLILRLTSPWSNSVEFIANFVPSLGPLCWSWPLHCKKMERFELIFIKILRTQTHHYLYPRYYLQSKPFTLKSGACGNVWLPKECLFPVVESQAPRWLAPHRRFLCSRHCTGTGWAHSLLKLNTGPAHRRLSALCPQSTARHLVNLRTRQPATQLCEQYHCTPPHWISSRSFLDHLGGRSHHRSFVKQTAGELCWDIPNWSLYTRACARTYTHTHTHTYTHPDSPEGKLFFS